MKYFNTIFSSLLAFSFLLSSCGKSEAERLGIKWCECNMQKAKLFKELDQTTDVAKINKLVTAIMIEEQSAIDCMEVKKLKTLEEKLSPKEKGEFQQDRKSASFYVCKSTVYTATKNVDFCCQKLRERYVGQVPVVKIATFFGGKKRHFH